MPRSFLPRSSKTLYYSEQGRLLGEAVQKKILSKVPTIDRGCKERQGLYVLRRTVMTAILVELAYHFLKAQDHHYYQ